MTEAGEKEMVELRILWKKVREDRLARKRILLEKGLTLTAIRKEKEHKRLQKEQDRCASRLKHLNAARSRALAKTAKAEEL